jgi:type II secretory pathway component GspD/PulD (secretin)
MEAVADWIARLDKPIPIITEDRSLDRIENKNQVVQRFISLKHYDPVRMSEIVTPLLTESGHITAEESTRTLLLIDTVENLLRIEAVIGQFDEPQAEHVATEVFEVRQRTPEEVIQLLQTILSEQANGAGTSYGRRSSQIGRARTAARRATT